MDWSIPEREGLYASKTKKLDMNGDGKTELAVLYLPLPDSEKIGYLSLLNREGEEIARISRKEINPPAFFRMEKYKLDSNNPKEYLRADCWVGPHQSEAMFFTLENENIYSIPNTDNPESIVDYVFYIESHSLIVKDLNQDGYMEVCEIVREFSLDGELSEEEEGLVKETFGEKAEEAQEAVEAGLSRGKTAAIWRIFSFNGEYFERKINDDYDQLFSMLKNENLNFIKRDELSDIEIERVENIRNFWTHRESN